MDVIDGVLLWTPVVQSYHVCIFKCSSRIHEYYVSRKCEKRGDTGKISEIILYIYIYTYTLNVTQMLLLISLFD